MKKISFTLLALFLPSCTSTPTEPSQYVSRIEAYVHWQDQALPQKQIELVQTGETKVTDSSGIAAFSVPPGRYVIRAYGINRGGPALTRIDFDVFVKAGTTARVDIVDCLPCM